MKYIWIVMLMVIDAIWIVASVIEFSRAVNVTLKWKYDSTLDLINDLLTEVEDYATGCLFTHVFALFLISLCTFLTE